jgi:hypothetical protein
MRKGTFVENDAHPAVVVLGKGALTFGVGAGGSSFHP